MLCLLVMLTSMKRIEDRVDLLPGDLYDVSHKLMKELADGRLHRPCLLENIQGAIAIA